MKHKVAELDELAPGQRKLCDVDGRRVVVFNVNGGYLAYDNHCPHRGGPVGAGAIVDGRLTCPWHGLQFELSDGRGCQHDAALRSLPVRQLDDGLYIEIPSIAATDRGRQLVLVRYGAAAEVAHFTAPASLECQRLQWVVMQTERGQEVGEVLARRSGAADAVSAGDVLRVAGDVDLARRGDHQRRLQPLLPAIRETLVAQAPPIELIDCEVLQDGQSVVLYHLGESHKRLGPVASLLGEQHRGYHFQFQSLADGAGAPLTSTRGAEDVKGPDQRTKYDFRRLWECPVCGHHERKSGDVTSLLCRCQDKVKPTEQKWMKMVSEGARP